MDIFNTINLLETLIPLLGLVPVAGGALVAMIEAAVDVCKSVESAGVNRSAYEQLAQEVAGYTTAVSQETQLNRHFLSVIPGSKEERDRQQEAWMRNIFDLIGAFREVSKTIQERQSNNNERPYLMPRGTQHLQNNMRNENDDKKQAQQLQRKIESYVRAFHIRTSIRGLGELERSIGEIKDTAALQAQATEQAVEPTVSHVRLLHGSLVIMDRYLRRDMCNIGDPSVMNADIRDLEDKLNQYLPPELRYACEYWLFHLACTSHFDGDLVNRLNIFCSRHLLHWVEVLSLLNKVSVANINIYSAIGRCRSQGPDTLTATMLLKDIERAVEIYGSPIRSCALQVYCSVLLFMPECRLDQHTKHEAMGTIKLKSQRLKTWSSTRIMEGHTSYARSVGFSPDGTRIVSGSGDHTVRVWDAITGGVLAQLDGHAGPVTSVGFSSDATKIVSGSEDRTVRVWETVTGGVLVKIGGHTDVVTSVVFSPDGTRIASSSEDQTVRVWDTITGIPLAKLDGHTGLVTSVAFSPDGSRIASSSNDRTVRVWDAITGSALNRLDAFTEAVNSVTFSPDGTRIASGSDDQTIRIWDAITGDALTKLDGHSSWVTSVAFSPDGMEITSSSNDATVRLWNVITGETLAKLETYAGTVGPVAFSPGGTRITFGSNDGNVRVWDVTIGGVLANPDSHTLPVTSVAFSPDRTRFASGSGDGIIRLWDAITGGVLAKLNGHTDLVSSVAFSPDGTRIASGSSDNTARVWDGITGSPLTKFDSHSASVTCVAFSPDGTRIASGSRDDTVCVWDVTTGGMVAKFVGRPWGSWVTSVTFSPDGTQIAFGSEVGWAVQIWDVDTGNPLARLEGHTSRVVSVAFSPDGTQVASGSEDKAVLTWDVVTGSVLAKLDDHIDPVTYVAFSEDGTRIISRDSTGSQRILLTEQLSSLSDQGKYVASLDESSPHLYFDKRSGWLEARMSFGRGSKRLCWIPHERRGVFYPSGDIAVFFSKGGKLTLLSTS